MPNDGELIVICEDDPGTRVGMRLLGDPSAVGAMPIDVPPARRASYGLATTVAATTVSLACPVLPPSRVTCCTGRAAGRVLALSGAQLCREGGDASSAAHAATRVGMGVPPFPAPGACG